MSFRNIFLAFVGLVVLGTIRYTLDIRYTILLDVSPARYVWWIDPKILPEKSPEDLTMKIDPFISTSRTEDLTKRIYSLYRQNNVNCSALFLNVPSEKLKSKRYHETHQKIPRNSTFYFEAAQNCTRFQEDRSYIMDSLTEKEKDFPIAYSIVLYRETELFER